ncbi:MAG: SIR2 family protein [Propionibacteriaceae bacterium]|jgi:translation initiation factor 2B subunit (eIF-2B alpha/beta/delta family)|nr:SIR2 family protein [Propionibacteriaceae bacterium]
MNDILQEVVLAAKERRLIGFLGAGASAPYQDQTTGRTWPGIPTAAQMVQELCKRYNWVDKELDFAENMFLYRKKEGRAALERFLRDQVNKPYIKPMPVHSILASLGLRAFITTNYDQLLETALTDGGRHPTVVVDDSDVALVESGQTTVIKYHGCITRPASLIAALDEYVPVSQERPIVSALMTSLLANQSLLFLGFGLSDRDFVSAYETVRRTLGAWMPRSYAVVRQVRNFERSYWESNGLSIIEGDLTEFARQMSHQTASSASNRIVMVKGIEDNPFFDSLSSISAKPSETQFIDSFLGHLRQELDKDGLPAADVLSAAALAQRALLDTRSNFAAFRRVGEATLARLRQTLDNGRNPAVEMEKILNDRTTISLTLSSIGGLIDTSKQIATYSQSQRVLQVLRGVKRSVQASSRVFIAECRPKSPAPFQDAMAIIGELQQTSYSLTIVPDMGLLNLLNRNQVDLLLLGAHAVYVTGDGPKWFVNTAGSNALTQVALTNGVPVWILAEDLKLIEVMNGEVPEISHAEEEDIFSSVELEFTQFLGFDTPPRGLNVGYELTPCGSGMTVITESNQWIL